MTDEEIIERFLNIQESFRSKCVKLGINYGSAYEFRKNHPELTEYQVLAHYRNDIYINILGEIIIPKN